MTIPPLLMLAQGRRARPRKAKAPPPKEIALHMAVANVLRRFANLSWRWSALPGRRASRRQDGREAARRWGLARGFS